MKPPALWGTQEHLQHAVPATQAALIHCQRRIFNFRYASPAHWIEVFRTYYGPTHKAFAALDANGQHALTRDLTALLEQMNVAARTRWWCPASTSKS